jgi:hypothetical protein
MKSLLLNFVCGGRKEIRSPKPESRNKSEIRNPKRIFQDSVAADVSRRKHLKLARTNVRVYGVLKEAPNFLAQVFRHFPLPTLPPPADSSDFELRISDLFRTSDFGLRTSDFQPNPPLKL